MLGRRQPLDRWKMIPDIRTVRAKRRRNWSLQSNFCLSGTFKKDFSTNSRVINEVVLETLCTKPPLRFHRSHTNCRKGGTLDDRDPIRDPRDREPRQARLACEGHSQPAVEG